MSFFSPSSSSRALPPFSIDDAFDIPEDVEEEDEVSGATHEVEDRRAKAPIIKNGQIRLEMERVGPGGGDAGHAAGASGADDASLIQTNSVCGGTTSGDGDTIAAAAAGYYPGPPSLKYWWMHPKIRSNIRVVAAACLLVLLGIGLMVCGIAVFCLPNFGSAVQAGVFVIAGIICFVPGAYHIVYIYMAVKGKRGYEFNHLPLFNN